MNSLSARDDMAAYMRSYRAKKKRKHECLECGEDAVGVKGKEGKVVWQKLCKEHGRMHSLLQRVGGDGVDDRKSAKAGKLGGQLRTTGTSKLGA